MMRNIVKLEIVVDVFKPKIRDERSEEGDAFVNLCLELVLPCAGFEHLAMSVFLCTLDACRRARPAIRHHRVAFDLLSSTPRTCFVQSPQSPGLATGAETSISAGRR